MPTGPAVLSEYRSMWLFAMFDLPVETGENRRNYTQFRNSLIKKGFMMLQYSVYARFIPSEEAADAYRRHLRRSLPPDGQVRLLAVKNYQFDTMEVFYGKTPRKAEDPPPQLALF